ncbi:MULTISPECIES: tol-pal system protein YbgF [unclassified Achromobacter]|uniref:tol-pal system protein YbgF n=1 Tax=unclassified Achromobacter TaxID=2626865 RepID=UPI000B51ABC8|nr:MULTISPECIES: tol-pal system protein YbgF [unclassified Achromobacter]OWT73390.1 tol-pal system protein YbgF [Achromobacter sp. HZ34]OWT79693.1 tol-pal system protein YbgF [Achromobacter sp. HZ28]
MSDRVSPLRALAAAAGLAFGVLSFPAHAFADDEARKAILDLRQQVQQQNDQNVRARLQLADQIQSLQTQIQQLQNQLELATRQPAGGNKAGGNPADTGSATAGDPQEQSAYDGAIDMYRKGQYKDAAESLTAFTALYPNSELVPSAQFYLGSSRYAQKDFKGAIEQLNNMVQKSPDNARAPDALLVVAGSQIELNNRAGAKTTLQRIVKDYPTTPAATTAKSRLQLLQ